MELPTTGGLVGWWAGPGMMGEREATGDFGRVGVKREEGRGDARDVAVVKQKRHTNWKTRGNFTELERRAY